MATEKIIKKLNYDNLDILDETKFVLEKVIEVINSKYYSQDCKKLIRIYPEYEYRARHKSEESFITKLIIMYLVSYTYETSFRLTNLIGRNHSFFWKTCVGIHPNDLLAKIFLILEKDLNLPIKREDRHKILIFNSKRIINAKITF